VSAPSSATDTLTLTCWPEPGGRLAGVASSAFKLRRRGMPQALSVGPGSEWHGARACGRRGVNRKLVCPGPAGDKVMSDHDSQGLCLDDYSPFKLSRLTTAWILSSWPSQSSGYPSRRSESADGWLGGSGSWPGPGSPAGRLVPDGRSLGSRPLGTVQPEGKGI
jgi:hypothetical protein